MRGGAKIIRLGKLIFRQSFAHERKWLNDTKVTREHNVTLAKLHKDFIAKCQELGICSDQYPLNVDSKGYFGLRKYVYKMESENVLAAARRQSKDSLQKIRSTGYGKEYSIDYSIPYECVQLDGHKLNVVYCVESVDPDTGEITYQPATRAWLLVVLDSATRVALGYSMTREQNYNGTDVLNAFSSAIIGHEKREYRRKKRYVRYCYDGQRQVADLQEHGAGARGDTQLCC